MNHTFSFLFKAKYIVPLVCLLALSLLSMLVINAARLHKTIEEANTTHRHLLECDQAGDLLRTGSDILTNAVRSYIVTGDPVYRNEYFKEANEDRHREAGLAKVATLLNGEELRKVLAEGMNHSMNLMRLEYHAMRLVISDRELAQPDCPPEIRNYALTDEELAASPEARQKIATEIVFGQEYADYKKDIYGSTDKTLESAKEFFTSYRKEILRKNKRMYSYQAVTFIGFILLLWSLSFSCCWCADGRTYCSTESWTTSRSSSSSRMPVPNVMCTAIWRSPITPAGTRSPMWSGTRTPSFSMKPRLINSWRMTARRFLPMWQTPSWSMPWTDREIRAVS